MTPRIAVALRNDDDAQVWKAGAYLDWLRRFGAEPVVVSPQQGRLPSSAAALLLTGGEDVDPALYGEPNLHARRVDRGRDDLDLALVAEALRREVPILGICRGAQVLAVALGGTLVQDIPSEPPVAPVAVIHHSGEPAGDVEHDAWLEPDSRLARALGRTLRVNSRHHQAVRRVPAPARVVGRAADGVAEAIELDGARFTAGVQWHPERWDQPSSNALLRAFLDAARSGTSRA